MDSATWLPIATLVGGYAGALTTESFRDARQRRREIEAREADRVREVDSLHQQFQRETLLELQQAMADMARATGAIHHQDVVAYRNAGGTNPFTRQQVPGDLNQRSFEAMQKTMLLMARVDHEGLRANIKSLRELVTKVLLAQSESEANGLMVEAMDLQVRINDQIGELLRTR